jgi:flagellar protein FlaF
MSITAYKQTIRQSESPRAIERRILMSLTADLEAQAGPYDSAGEQDRMRLLAGGLRDSVAENQRFWQKMRMDLSTEGNLLPAQLRAQLISLAIWVEKQSGRVIAGAGGLQGLVTINNHIIAGLSGEAPQPQGV